MINPLLPIIWHPASIKYQPSFKYLVPIQYLFGSTIKKFIVPITYFQILRESKKYYDSDISLELSVKNYQNSNLLIINSFYKNNGTDKVSSNTQSKKHTNTSNSSNIRNLDDTNIIEDSLEDFEKIEENDKYPMNTQNSEKIEENDTYPINNQSSEKMEENNTYFMGTQDLINNETPLTLPLIDQIYSNNTNSQMRDSIIDSIDNTSSNTINTERTYDYNKKGILAKIKVLI